MRPEDIKVVIKKKSLRNGKVFSKEYSLQELIESHPNLLWEGDTYKILEPPKVVFDVQKILENRPAMVKLKMPELNLLLEKDLDPRLLCPICHLETLHFHGPAVHCSNCDYEATD